MIRCVATILLVAGLAAPGRAADKQPNVVLIVIDDLGQRDLGCYGSTFYKTPNIDRMAKEGLRFTDF
jgi:arylsulfatase A-like enzyme